MVGAVATGIYVDKTGRYKSASLLMLLLTGAIVFLMTASLHAHRIDVFVVAALALGFASVGYVPVALAFGVELTFPMPAATANGSMLLLAQGFGFVQSLVVTFISDDSDADDLLTPEELLLTRQQRSKIAMLFLGSTVVLALGISCAVVEDLRRLRYMANSIINDKRAIMDGAYQRTHDIN